MQCPVDGTTLAISDKQGIEIDYCPQCRGIWLDRGELDKLVERLGSGGERSGSSVTHGPNSDDRRIYQEDHGYNKHDYYDGHDNYHHKHKKKRESFLGDLFDF